MNINEEHAKRQKLIKNNLKMLRNFQILKITELLNFIDYINSRSMNQF